MDPVRLFSLLSIVVIFVFYCIPRSKRSVYLLPVYPFIAYFLAEWMLWLWQRRPWVIHTFGSVLGVAAVMLTSVFVAVRLGFVPDTIFTGRHAAENIAFLHALETVPLDVISSTVIVVAPVLALKYLHDLMRRSKRRQPSMVLQPLIIAMGIYMALDGFYQPTVLNVKSDRSVAETVNKVQPDGPIYEYVQRGAGRYFNINFYTGDRVLIFDKALPERGTLVVGTADYREKLIPRFGDRYTFDLVLNSGHRSCDTKDTICVYRFQRRPATE